MDVSATELEDCNCSDLRGSTGQTGPSGVKVKHGISAKPVQIPSNVNSYGGFACWIPACAGLTLAMQSKCDCPARDVGYQAVDLPYSWGELSMTILLPDEGGLEEFEGSLDSEMLDRIIDEIQIDYITLTMPLFEFESEFDSGSTLAGMGMPDAFGAGADFSGMTGSRDLWIRAVVHKAFVSVDEKGTEAAAATAVVMLESGVSKEPIAVTVDRPFIFRIRDTDTGAVLFLGRVSNPDPA